MELLRNTSRQSGDNNRSYVYRVLYDNIIHFMLKPGSQFNEADIAAQLAVSRTPVREALSKLRDDRLIEVFPQKYSAVSLLDWSLICEGVEIRRLVEASVLQEASGSIDAEYQAKLRNNLAMQRYCLEEAQDIAAFQTLDQEMHRLIYASIGRGWSWDIVSRASQHFVRFLYLNDANVDYLRIPHLRQILGMHETLLDALFSGTPMDYAAFTKQHIFTFRSLPVALDIENIDAYAFRDYFKPPKAHTLARLRQLRGD